MSGPGRSPDELDEALALANGAPPDGSPGACTDCPARGGPARPEATPAGDSAPSVTPPEDDPPDPWLSAASASTEGLRGAAAREDGPEDDGLAPEWLLGSAGHAGEAPAGQRAEEPAGEGRLSGVMRALRPSETREGGADRDAPADDGLLPEWLTRAVRRAGRDRPEPPGPEGAHDPDDALAAPWVPRMPARSPGSPPGTAPSPSPASGPDRDPHTPRGPENGPDGPRTPTPDAAPPPADDAGAVLAPRRRSAAPGTPGPGREGEHPLPPRTAAGPGPQAPSAPAAPRTAVEAGASHGGATGPRSLPERPAERDGDRAGAAGGRADGTSPPPGHPDVVLPGAAPCARRDGAACPPSGAHGTRTATVSQDVPAGFGGPGRGGVPGERHDGEVTSPGDAAGAGGGTPVDVSVDGSEATSRTGRPGREPARPAVRSAPGADRGGPLPQGGAGARAAVSRPVPWEEARRIAARAVAPAAVTVPLDRAARQVLAAPVEALADLPSFDTAAMDGWAVAGPGPWTPAGPQGGPGVLAGCTAPEPLADGCAVRIATGARVPDGATAVLRSERAELRGGRLCLAADAPAHSAEHGTDIRPRGQECRTGDRLLPAGTTVTPPVLGLAAAAGYDRLTVTPRPRAEVLVLGDELLHAGLPSEGRVRDALGPMVGPWLTALGAEVLVTRRLGDDAEALHEAVTTTTADLLVTTGGTAHGPVDHVRPTLHRTGARLLVDGVEVRPGHPMLLAALAGAQEGRHLVGLPGNPLAAVSGLLTLAAPLLRARAGLPEPEPVRATLTAVVEGHPRDTRLVPVTRSADGSGATPLRWTGPAMLRGIAGASALAAVPPGGAAAGTSVRLLELPW